MAVGFWRTQEFEAFAGKNEGVFEAAGTSREEALTKMRLMALLGLGAHPHPVPFADVQASPLAPLPPRHDCLADSASDGCISNVLQSKQRRHDKLEARAPSSESSGWQRQTLTHMNSSVWSRHVADRCDLVI